MNRKNIKTSQTSVRRAIKELKLKLYRRRKSQKLTTQNKTTRVKIAN